ncbi:MAG: type I-E CRISPR-associated protein Cas7/Cse4/CasC, partial [Candidatus Bipolaricaulota bacterium]|nr:type I-E CRISPR-associated protein Cas7/Cse4/CasC [Candidatus Bipolaricaulota bacterium]
FGPLNPEWKGALNLTEGNAEGLPSLENFSQLKERVKEALEALLGG